MAQAISTVMVQCNQDTRSQIADVMGAPKLGVNVLVGCI